MFQAVAKPAALAAIEKRVLVEDFSQSITGRLRHQVDSKIAGHAHPIGVPSLAPLRRRIICLLHSARYRRGEDWIRPERNKSVRAQLFLFCRPTIGLTRLPVRRAWRHYFWLAGLLRWGRRLLLTRRRARSCGALRVDRS